MQVYKLACDYYGEDRVALQEDTHPIEYTRITTRRGIEANLDGTVWQTRGFASSQDFIRDVMEEKTIPTRYNLYIHWPEAVVTNEQDQSILIKNLFARIQLTHQGLAFTESEKITFAKTTFTRAQWNGDYVHSHVCPNTSINEIMFRHVCLGSGPINNTIHKLQMEPGNTEATMLFFWELDKVAHVESLKGVPYIRMSTLTQSRLEPIDEISDGQAEAIAYSKSNTMKDVTHDFVSSFIKAVEIPFAFREGSYVLGCSFVDFEIMLTNYYRKWKDAYVDMVNAGLAKPYPGLLPVKRNLILKDGALYLKNGASDNRSLWGPHAPFVFKGKEYPLVVEEDVKEEEYLKCTLLSLDLVRSILDFILTSINIATSYKYEESSKETKESGIGIEWYGSIQSRATEERDSGKTTNRTTVII